MKAEIEKLAAELREEAAGAPNDMICSGLARIADRLEALLREDAGGWRPIAELQPKKRDGGLFWFSLLGEVYGPCSSYFSGAKSCAHFMPCRLPSPPPAESAS